MLWGHHIALSTMEPTPMHASYWNTMIIGTKFHLIVLLIVLGYASSIYLWILHSVVC